MAVPGVKYDDGTGGFATNCFPVRGLIQENEDEGGVSSGAWLVAHKAEQRRRFKAVVCAKPRTYSQIREERKRALKEGSKMVAPVPADDDQEGEKVLDGFFLMKHCCVEDPADLCSVNVSGQGLSDVKEEDFCLFDNVAYVNVAENVLPFESFNNFPIIRELEMPLNGLRNLKINLGQFPHLETLDLSYNNLAPEDLLPLGLLPRLRVLSLTGNYLKTLPTNLTKPYAIPDSFDEIPRFPALEILMLDDNKFSDVNVFASLAGLTRLRQLNLSKNAVFVVPQLMLIDGRHVTQDSDAMKRSVKKLRSGRRSRSGKPKSSSSGRKSILKTTPTLEGPTNTPLLKRASPGDNMTADQDPQNHSVTFKEGEAPQPDAPETDVKALDDDLDFGELNLEQLDEQIEEETFQEAVAEHKAKSEQSGGASTGPTLPPFAELRSLNLSHNQIVDEDSLLAVAVFPMLAELIIHDNPLTIQNSGDPPLLRRYLTDRLGISIVRKRPDGPVKPRVELQIKPERKVKTVIPPVPRCNVDELLALEAPRETRSLLSGRSGSSSVRSGQPAQSPAPPTPGSGRTAPPTPGSGRTAPPTPGSGRTAPPTPGSGRTAPPTPGSGRTAPPTPGSGRMAPPTPGSGRMAPPTPGSGRMAPPTPGSGRIDRTTPLPPIPTSPKAGDGGRAGGGGRGEEEPSTKTSGQDDGDVFFMTQVDDPHAVQTDHKPQTDQTLLPHPPPKPKARGRQPRKASRAVVPDQYNEYEDLLTIPSEEDEGEGEVAQDLNSNVKSLQYMLNHPLVFRTKPVLPLDEPQPPFRPLTKQASQTSRPRKTRDMQMEDVLHTLRERSTVIETSLADVIRKTPSSREKQFTEAPRLLTEIQNRYNIVRATSLRDASDVILNAQEIMDDAMRKVDRISTSKSQKV